MVGSFVKYFFIQSSFQAKRKIVKMTEAVTLIVATVLILSFIQFKIMKGLQIGIIQKVVTVVNVLTYFFFYNCNRDSSIILNYRDLKLILQITRSEIYFRLVEQLSR